MKHVTAWVFDLDNTLYPPQSQLFDQLRARMNDWMVRHLGLSPAQAVALRADYRDRYGTTLAGLMAEHAIDPQGFLADVHEVALDALRPDPALAAAIRALPGRKIIHTNGSRAHARRVSAARGLEGVFDGLFGIEDAGYLPKPGRAAFERVLGLAGVEPGRAAMFEDEPRNLVVPRALGMVCVLVQPPPAPLPGHSPQAPPPAAGARPAPADPRAAGNATAAASAARPAVPAPAPTPPAAAPSEAPAEAARAVDYRTSDLTAFLTALAPA